jgi:hypothetical protein
MTTSQLTSLAPAPPHRTLRRARPAHHPVFSLADVQPSQRAFAQTRRQGQNRRRGVIRSRAIAVVVILSFVTIMLAANVGADAGPVETTRHHVASGETLWGLASVLTPQGESVWVYVSMLKELNDLESSTLQIDQVLLLPVAGS